MRLPGLTPPPVARAEARRAAIGAADDHTLAADVLRMSLALRELGEGPLSELADIVGLPVGEVLASPFAARAVALATTVGAATVHHEGRSALAWAEAAVDPAVAADPHGYWDRGVFHAGKYRSFMQDEPFATYNPNHMAKWGPHELMHRVCGFFWRPGLTRWELYLTARLNELVPVVLWYGLDEVARLDRDGFDRVRDAADRDAPLARAAWWHEPEDALRARIERTLPFLRNGLAHFDAELAAIDEEIASGRVVATPRDGLDASSDAIAYVVGHHARLVGTAQQALAEAVYFPELGIDAHVRPYRDRVVGCLDRLLFETIEVDPNLARSRRTARHVWDVAMRVTQHERFRPLRARDALVDAGAAVRALWEGAAADAGGAIATLLESLPSPSRAAVAATGLGTDTDESQLLDGVRSLAPATLDALDGLGWTVAELARLPRSRTDLAERLGALVAARNLPWLTSLYAFERAIAESVIRDDVAERLGEVVLPDDGWVSRARGFRIVGFEADPTEIHGVWQETGVIDPDLAGLPAALLVGALGDEVSVVPAPGCVERLWDALGSGPVRLSAAVVAADPGDALEPGLPETGQEWLAELAAAHAIVVLPVV